MFSVTVTVGCQVGTLLSKVSFGLSSVSAETVGYLAVLSKELAGSPAMLTPSSLVATTWNLVFFHLVLLHLYQK